MGVAAPSATVATRWHASRMLRRRGRGRGVSRRRVRCAMRRARTAKVVASWESESGRRKWSALRFQLIIPILPRLFFTPMPLNLFSLYTSLHAQIMVSAVQVVHPLQYFNQTPNENFSENTRTSAHLPIASIAGRQGPYRLNNLRAIVTRVRPPLQMVTSSPFQGDRADTFPHRPQQ
jgi:hypothetical protein